MREICKSNCHYCGYLCGFDATVEDGKLIDLAPDATRYPYDSKITTRCLRWRMNLAEIDGPTRVNYPLHRVGERGSGTFERVSWDEALNDIAERLSALRESYGPETLASAIGGPHATYWPLHRFLNVFGTPNNMGIGQICWNPRIWIDGLTYGWPIEVDINLHCSGAVLLWGTNPAESDNSLFWSNLKQLRAHRIPLIVIDVRRTPTAAIADVHLALRPGTDCYLALAFIHEIIAADLVDHDFIAQWCHGYEHLCKHVERFTPELASEKTGVAVEDIRRAAHMFAEPDTAALLSGRGIDQLGPNTAPTHRAISILRAITGNVDKPGACTIMDISDFIPEVELEMGEMLSFEQSEKQLNIDHSPLQSYPGYRGADALTGRFGKHLPQRYLTSAHPGLVFDAMDTGRPYPIKALLVMAANPVVTYANTNLVTQALKKLDLLVVLDYYLTPTAQLADYVLPSAGAFERPLFQAHGGVSNFAYGGAAAVRPYYERRTDYEIIRGIACRLGQEQYWPDATLEEALDRTMKRAGKSFDDFAATGLYCGPLTFWKQNEDDGTGSHKGFSTTTGRIELENEYIKQLGGEDFPTPVDGAIAQTTEPDEVILITGARTQPYWASSYFQNEDFRRRHPDPLISMNGGTLARLGLRTGDWVRVWNTGGSALFRVKEADMPDDVASAEYGWWYPEEQPGLPELSGAFRSNINQLTSASIAHCEQLIGSWTYNGIIAHIVKVEQGNDATETVAYDQRSEIV